MAVLSKAGCAIAPAGRRRIFWATQADACGTVDDCGATCGRPGLRLAPITACNPIGCNAAPPCPTDDLTAGATFANDNWVEGLILNILLTDARRDDSGCGYRPGQRGGHWSDALRGDGESAGCQLRQQPVKCSVNEAVALAEATVANALAKLVAHGVARSVDVTVTYRGSNRYHIDITVTGDNIERMRVGITGQRLAESWVWGTQRAA